MENHIDQTAICTAVPGVAVMAIAKCGAARCLLRRSRVRLEPNAARVLVTLPVTLLRVEEHRWTRDALKRSLRQAA